MIKKLEVLKKLKDENVVIVRLRNGTNHTKQDDSECLNKSFVSQNTNMTSDDDTPTVESIDEY